ncbi:MAG: phosphatase PAP2 family protein [Planctomycetota bacterium]
MSKLDRPGARWLLLLVIGSSSGCGTLPNGKRWGEDAALFPGWERLGEAAASAATDPLTWVPLAGAAVFQIDDWDENLSDWATDHTPLFGSAERASDARGWTGNLSDLAYAVTALATPSGPETGDWLLSKLKGVAVGVSARTLTLVSGDALKNVAGRTRPNGSDDSFPSGHAARLGVNLTLAARNARSLATSETVGTALDTSFLALAAAGSWSRVEAGDHYPSDVLVGFALGHFLGAVINDAFLGLEVSGVGIGLVPLDGGGVVEFSICF